MQSVREDGKLFLSWSDVTSAVIGIAARIKDHHYEPKRILAVARGGLIPATLLSHLLGVKEVGSIQLESYNEEHTSERIRMYRQTAGDLNNFQHWGNFASYWDKADTLVVDDLWDSGNTHNWIHEMFPEAVATTLFYKDRDDNSHRIVSFPGAPLNKDRWVVFPWEIA